MSSASLVRAAARNNAEWCHAFCRTYGVVGRIESDLWSSQVRTPLLFPDAVTLSPIIAGRRIIEVIDASEGCSVKDSFAFLDLSAAGFSPLFRAHWVVKKPDARHPPAPRWLRITTEAELQEWEAT